MFPMTDTLSRDTIISQWFAQEALTAAAALSVNYAVITQAARVRLGAEPYWALITQDERDKAAKSGAARPDGSYPVLACTGDNSVDSAIHAVGMGGADHDTIREHIITRAKSLGCASKIPDNWNADGSLKADASASASVTAAGAVPDAPAAAPAVPVAPDGKTSAAPDATDGAKADMTVSEILAQAKDIIARALKAQQADPDNEKDPKDAKVLAGIEQIASIVDGVIKDQAADSAGAPAPAVPDDKTAPVVAPPAPGTAAPATPAAASMASETPGNQEGVPGDADDSPPSIGDIDNAEVCQNPECGHMAPVHADTDDGNNQGACSTPGCMCMGMVPAGTSMLDPDDTTGGPDNQGGDQDPDAVPGALPTDGGKGAVTAAGPDAPTAAPDAPAPAAAPDAPAIQPVRSAELPPLNPEPQMPTGAEFTIPVAAIEGVPTGDGRIIEPDALTWRMPPLPLMGMKTSPHDPGGMSPNDPAVLIGRIESITRDGQNIVANGHLLPTEDGDDFTAILAGMGRMGVSIDVGSAEVQITAEPMMPSPMDPGAFDESEPPMEHLVAGEIMGITVCPFPAFAGAYIVLGDGSNIPDGDLGTPTPEQASMGIRFVDAVACEPCEGGLPLTASAAGPLAPPKGWFEDPGFHIGDDRLKETIDSKTGRPSGKFACPLTVTEDGRVFGHIAQWGVCHTSPQFMSRGQCVMAPRSKTGYAWFHGRGSVLTAEGELLDVGRLTADTGHASTAMSVSAAQAIAHYDNSGLTAAVVRAGEDNFGIWVSGALHPSTSPEQIYTLRANPPSGDWRPVGSGQELVAVLCVNEPGFPVAKAMMSPSSGHVTSLVAAGVPLFTLPAEIPLTDAERLDMLERGFAPLARMARNDAVARMAALRG
jgi:hypothetical protein